MIEVDSNFVLRCMDGETVEGEIALDPWQLAFDPKRHEIKISLSGNDVVAIRDLPSVQETLHSLMPIGDCCAWLRAAAVRLGYSADPEDQHRARGYQDAADYLEDLERKQHP